MNDMTFPLLAALSSTEIAEENELEKKLSEIRKIIENELLPILFESNYVEKSHLEMALGHVLKDSSILCGHQELLGRTCVGIICADKTALPVIDSLGLGCDHLSSYGCDSCFHNVWTMRSSIPLRLFHTTETPYVTAANLMGRDVIFNDNSNDQKNKRTALQPEEYQALLALDQDGINPRDMVSALSFFSPLKRPQSSYFIVSPEEFEHYGYGQYISQCDVIFIFGTLDNEHCISTLRNNFNMPIYFVTADATPVQRTVENIKNSSPGRIVEIIKVENVDYLLDEYDGYVSRITIHDRLMCEMLAFIEFISLKINQNKTLIDSIKRDSILSTETQSNMNDILEKILNEFLKTNEILEKNKNEFTTAYYRVLASTAELETLLHNASPTTQKNDDNFRLHAGSMRPTSLWRRIILRALMSGNFALAEKYQNKFAKLYPDHAFLTELYIKKNKHVPILASSIEKLRAMANNPEVLRAKIYFRDELELSEQDCAEMAAQLPRRKNADEKYFWAVHLNKQYQQNKNSKKKKKNLPFTDVLNAFRSAVLAGSNAAAQTFAMYCGGERLFEEACEIADMAHPAGAFIYRLLCQVRGDSATANRYLKMAAALGYPKALSIFAEECWENRTAGEAISFDYEEGVIKGIDSANIRAAISIYEYLQENRLRDVDISDIPERLGYFYFCTKQWRNSRKFLGNSPITPEGKFSLAVMLKYGHGGSINKKNAISLMREAESMDGFFADAAATVKKRWFAEDIARL